MAFNLSVTAQELNSAITKANAAAPQSTTYTKSETDTLLAGKVDKETGKGLSTNDFTTTEKNKLSGIESGATKTVIDTTLSGTSTNPVQNKVIQAAIAERYTKSDTDTLLAGKVDKETGKGLSTNDFTTTEKNKLSGIESGATKTVIDTTLSGTSTNPVQNKAVQAPVARLVDAVAKNLLYIYDQNVEAQGISYVVKDGIVIASGTANGTPSSRVNLESVLLPPGEYFFSGCPANGSDTTYRVDLYTSTDDTSYSLDNNMIDRGTGVAFTISTQMYVRPAIRFQNGYVASNLAFKPMICTAEDYAISPEFVPYAPSNRELYEMILALQNAENGG